MEIDYMHTACLAAGYVKTHMKNNKVALITDNGTKGYMESIFDEKQIDMSSTVVTNQHDAYRVSRKHQGLGDSRHQTSGSANIFKAGKIYVRHHPRIGRNSQYNS